MSETLGPVARWTNGAKQRLAQAKNKESNLVGTNGLLSQLTNNVLRLRWTRK
jgi:hypothetical protein